MLTGKDLNLPNKLSIFRLVLVPVFILIYFSNWPYSYIIAALIFGIAGLTDLLDGYLARKYNMITILGKVLDPLADKLLQFSATCSLYFKGFIPPWIVLIFMCKDLCLLLGGATMYRKFSDVIPSNKVGKFASFTLFFLVFLFVLHPGFGEMVATFAFTAALLFNLVAFIFYYILYRQVLSGKRPVTKQEEH